MANPDYGLDIQCGVDLNPMLTTVTGIPLMTDVCTHRLYCRKGGLLSNPNDNTLDARDFLSQGISGSRDLLRINAACQAALLGDDRISQAQVSASFNTGTRELLLTIQGTGSLGPFFLVLRVTELTIEKLQG